MVLESASHNLHDAIVARRIDRDTFIDYTAMMIVGLAHLHKHHILHGDLKPLNILITEQNVVRVADRVEMET